MVMAYYISAHGYGHGVRSCDVLAAELARDAGVQVRVTTDLPEDFLRARLPQAGERMVVRRGAFDVGMVQRDSIRVDVDATLEANGVLLKRADERLAGEAAFLRGIGARVVVADIPSLPLEAAAELGLTAYAIGNFSWDWIYSPFVERDERWRGVIAFYERGYRRADRLLKLPFSPAMEVFERQTDVSLVARAGRARRGEMARMAGADEGKQWVLLSFTTLDWDEAALRQVEQLEGVELFTVLPLQWEGHPRIHALDRRAISFSDVVASVDVVVSKPGFGILSDCAVNGKPLVYAEREDFIEYPVLERELKRYLKNAHIPAAKLYAGDLAETLEAVGRAPEPAETIGAGGAEMIANIVLR